MSIVQLICRGGYYYCRVGYHHSIIMRLGRFRVFSGIVSIDLTFNENHLDNDIKPLPIDVYQVQYPMTFAIQ